MNSIQLRVRTLAVCASIVLAAGVIGVATLASAESGGPTVVLSSTTTSPTNVSSIPVTATFSEGVTGFDASDITLGGTASSSVSGFASTSNSVYTFSVVPTTEGTVTAGIAADMASSSATSTGNQASNTLTLTVDRTAPVISGVSVATTTTTAIITWSTDESATGNVSYGTTTSYGASSTLEVSGSTSHSATLTGLSAGTTYHYQISESDAAGNTATTSDATFTTAPAPLAPTISGISVSNVSTTGATINWSTDLPSSSQVDYGTTTSYGSTSFDATATTSHAMTLTGLGEATLYHFDVRSGNAVGTTTSADNQFVTKSTASTTPLAVTGTDAVRTSATADDTFVHGWEWTMHLTVPDNEDAFRMKFSDWTGSAGSFATANHVRIFSPQSSNATSESSSILETSNSYGGWMYLTGDTAALTPGRQIDVTIQVAVPSGTAAGSYSTTFGAQSVPSTATSTTP